MFRDKIQFFQIAHEILHPEGGPLADRHQLRGLIVGIAQCGHGAVFHGERGQIFDDRQQFPPEKPQGLPVENQIGVVGDIAACRAQMENPGGGRRGLAVGVDVRHYVMADFPLPARRQIKVNVVDLRFQFGDLFRRDGQAEIVFGAGQFHPEPPPGPDARPVRKEVQKKFRRVPGR